MLFQKRDFYAGTLMILLGGGAVVAARENPYGSLMHMGPGFFPTILGVILMLLGVLIAIPAFAKLSSGPERILPEHPEWWGWFCILAGPVLFIIFGEIGGMAPATFACVFVSALGDRTQRAIHFTPNVRHLFQQRQRVPPAAGAQAAEMPRPTTSLGSMAAAGNADRAEPRAVLAATGLLSAAAVTAATATVGSTATTGTAAAC